MSKELIRLQDLTMEFDGERILDGINLYFNDHEFLTLLGPSGCGKTTTLRIIGGFLTPTSGTVTFDGKVINDVPPYKRQINTVFQRYALFPHLDVYDNVAFGLKVAKLPKDEVDRRVNEMLEIVSLKGYENRSVDSLSGGQQQRVAIARALVNQPKVLLLDEPLAALDLRLRKDMQIELKRIQQTTGTPVPWGPVWPRWSAAISCLPKTMCAISRAITSWPSSTPMCWNTCLISPLSLTSWPT